MRWVLLFAWLGIGCGSGPVTNADGNTRCFEPLDTYCSKATTCVTSYSDDRTTARRACAREPTVVHVTIGHCLGWRIATIRLRGGDTFTSLFTALGQLYAVLEGTDCIAGPDGITLLAACEPPDFEIDCDAVDAGM